MAFKSAIPLNERFSDEQLEDYNLLAGIFLERGEKPTQYIIAVGENLFWTGKKWSSRKSAVKKFTAENARKEISENIRGFNATAENIRILDIQWTDVEKKKKTAKEDYWPLEKFSTRPIDKRKLRQKKNVGVKQKVKNGFDRLAETIGLNVEKMLND